MTSREANAEQLKQENARLREALSGLQSFVAVMVGRGPDATIPETVDSPIGVPIKIGSLMRDVASALAPQSGGTQG